MRKLGGGGILIAGVFLIFMGWLIQSDLLEWLLNILGFVVIVAGIILGIYGLVQMFTGDKSGASDY